ncbi:MAG TPA: DUF4199 domain-containing protein [Bacteroidales bacterium]|jgi:hypothetical protein|nr:DUF4199 domain-containing protein [Bacteroidales bacterium]
MKAQQNPNSIRTKYAADYGLILGLYLAFFYLLQVLFKSSTLIQVIGSLSSIGVLFLSYYLVKRYRDKGLGGYIRYWSAWSFGVWLYLFAGLIMSVAYFIHFQWIDPNYLSDTFNQSLVLLEQMNYPQETIDQLLENGIPNNIQMVVSFLFAYIVGGALLFLILAAIVRKKAPDQWHTNAEDDYVPYADQKNTDSNEHE